MYSFKRTSLITLILLITASLAMAQGTGKIAGSVDDENGALAGVNVIIEGTFLGSSTDSDGMYLINHVPAGTYIVIANYIGYKTQKKEVTVNAEESVKVNFTLQLDLLQMDAVIITGTAGGLGIRKRDASFAINTIDATEIERLSPSSTAAVLDVIPGVWSESTGGVAGANIMVRGLPSGGDAPFVTMSINGGPIYGVETLSFLEQSTMFRVDETIELTEASRGGPSAVFSNAEPGMTVNFNLKKGGEKTKGRIKYQTSDYNLQRIDAVMSGKITDGLYYMAGGYARTSPGVRSTEFNAENGKQFTMQLTKTFDRGALNFFTRLTDDYGQWVLPMALETGNDLGTFSPLGNANRFRELQINEKGDTKTFDFAKGRGWKGSVSGLSFNFDLGAGWMVSDVLTYTSGDANTFGFVPNGNPMRVSTLKSKLNVDTVKTRGGINLGNSEYVQSYGYWVVMKNLESINNDISLNKIWNDHNITLGLYQARWTSKDFWTLGNHVPVHNVANGDILDASIPVDSIAGSWNYGLQYAGDARVFAVYGADSWQMTPALRFDIGLRYQFFDLQYTLDHGSLPDGQTDVAESLSGKDFASTAAVNYDFTKELGVFARGSRSYLFPNFDMIRENHYGLDSDGNLESNEFMQYEMGVKYTSQLFSLFTTAFYNTVDVIEGGVGSTREAELLSTKTMGVELDGALSFGDFMLRAVGTFQKGEITDSDVDDTVVGNSIWRQPDVQLRVAPSYNLAIENYNAVIYGALRYAGKRWDSVVNVYQLDPYTKIDLGAVVSTPGGMSFGLHVDNLTDCEGLTEGDPRDPASANGRPLFGRSIKFSVTHDF